MFAQKKPWATVSYVCFHLREIKFEVNCLCCITFNIKVLKFEMKTSKPGNIIALLDLNKVDVLSKIKYLIKISHKLLLPAQLRSMDIASSSVFSGEINFRAL